MKRFWSLANPKEYPGLACFFDGLLTTGRPSTFVPGALISDPDAGGRAFACVSGTIKAAKLFANGREVLVTILNAGSVWSDSAMVSGYWKDVFLEAVAPTTIVSVTATELEELIRSSPERSANFMRTISEQIADVLTFVEIIAATKWRRGSRVSSCGCPKCTAGHHAETSFGDVVRACPAILRALTALRNGAKDG